MDKKTKQIIDGLTTDTEMLRFIAAKSHESERHLNGIRNVALFFCVLAIFWMAYIIITGMFMANAVKETYHP